MCEANAYILDQGQEELILESVDIIKPENGEFYLRSISGEQKVIKAKIKEISLINHKIVFERR